MMLDEQIIRLSLSDLWQPSYGKIKAEFPDAADAELTSRYTCSLRQLSGASSSANILNIIPNDSRKGHIAFASVSVEGGYYSLVASQISDEAIVNSHLCDSKVQPTAGAIITFGDRRDECHFLFGGADGTLRLVSSLESSKHSAQTAPAVVFDNHHQDEPVLAIHKISQYYSPSYSATDIGAVERRFLFWVVFASAVNVIECDIFANSAPTLRLVASFAVDRRTLGSFSSLESLDSRYGPGTFCALHFIRTSSIGVTAASVVVPVDTRILWLHADKVLRGRDAPKIDVSFSAGCALVVPIPPTTAAPATAPIASAVDPQTVRTCAPIRTVSFERMFTSFSFEVVVAVAVAPPQQRQRDSRGTAFARGSLTTGEQWLIDEIREKGVQVLVDPNAQPSFPPSKKRTAASASTRATATATAAVIQETVAFFDQEGNQLFVSLSSGNTKLPSAIAVEMSSFWRACLYYDLCRPSVPEKLREITPSVGVLLGASSVQTGDIIDVESGRFLRRVMLEAVLCVGEASLIGEYIVQEAPAARTGSSGYLLEDVASILNWAVDVYHTTKDKCYATQGLAVTWLLNKDGNVSLEGQRPHKVDAFIEGISASANVCQNLITVLGALLQRKEMAFSSLASDGNDEEGLGAEARMEHDHVVRELHRMAVDCRILAGVLRLLSFLCRDEVFGFASLLLASSSSSSAEYSSFGRKKLLRRVAPTEMDFLPESLRTESLLYDHLVEMLPVSLSPRAESIVSESLSPSGIDENSLIDAIVNFLWLPVECAAASTTSGELSGNAHASICMEAAAAGHSVVLYILLDAYVSSIEPFLSPERTTTALACVHFARAVAQCLGMPDLQRDGVLSLWRVDSGIDVGYGIRAIGNKELGLFGDSALLLKVTKRLLNSGRKAEARSLLNRLIPVSPFMRTQPAILALAASGTEGSTWQLTWHAARRQSNLVVVQSDRDSNTDIGETTAVNSAPTPSNTRRAIVVMLCNWAILRDATTGTATGTTGNGASQPTLGKFLSSVFEDEEEQEVEHVLREYANSELSEGAFPCAAIDTLIYWLLQRRKVSAAKLVHEAHSAALDAHLRSPDARTGFVAADDTNATYAQTAFEAIEARRTLIDNYGRFPKIPLRPYRISIGNIQQ